MKSVNEIIVAVDAKGWQVKEQNFDGLAIVDQKRRRVIIASWGGGWEHVSVSCKDRSVFPSWDDMCELKEVFWKDEECCVQYHPAKSDYVNNVVNCLHIWRPIEQFSGKLPIPDSLLVGIKGLEFDG